MTIAIGSAVHILEPDGSLRADRAGNLITYIVAEVRGVSVFLHREDSASVVKGGRLIASRSQVVAA